MTGAPPLPRAVQTLARLLARVLALLALALALALMVASGPPSGAAAQTAETPAKPEPAATIDPKVLDGAPIPDLLRVVTLVKTALITLNNANAAGDYSILLRLASPQFREAHTNVGLGDQFRWWRDNRIDLSPTVILRPEFAAQPLLTRDGILRATGSFPSSPLTIDFDLTFRPVAGVWRLDGLGVRARKTPAPPAKAPE